ncbi:MAG: YihY/virulence factor BrkB family protein [Tistlia sp.]|uniref:YihY/virulence factor BrkB family protein n=1 Tax=Tistlia sp. TaxID=3057121 RepID=UPI0034A4C313
MTDRSGRSADQPGKIPPRGWLQSIWRVKDEIGRDNIGIVAGGVSFYAFLAIFPALAAAGMIWGAVADPAVVREQLAAWRGVIPPAAYEILDDQLTQVSSSPANALSLGAAFSLLLALWSSTKGVKSLMAAMNIAYGETERRGWFKLNLVALALTVGAILMGLTAIAAVAVAPALLAFLDLGFAATLALAALRWGGMLVLVMVGLAVLYRWGPSRRDARLCWVTPGAVVATLLWLIASAGFSIYVANFANYNETFGALGAVVILLMWFWLTGYAICLGAELNCQLELQTARDTTVGPERPMGERGAYAADHVAGERSEPAPHGPVGVKPG